MNSFVFADISGITALTYGAALMSVPCGFGVALTTKRVGHVHLQNSVVARLALTSAEVLLGMSTSRASKERVLRPPRGESDSWSDDPESERPT